LEIKRRREGTKSFYQLVTENRGGRRTGRRYMETGKNHQMGGQRDDKTRGKPAPELAEWEKEREAE